MAKGDVARGTLTKSLTVELSVVINSFWLRSVGEQWFVRATYLATAGAFVREGGVDLQVTEKMTVAEIRDMAMQEIAAAEGLVL